MVPKVFESVKFYCIRLQIIHETLLIPILSLASLFRNALICPRIVASLNYFCLFMSLYEPFRMKMYLNRKHSITYAAKDVRRFYGKITGNQLPVHFPFFFCFVFSCCVFFTGARKHFQESGTVRQQKDMYCFWSYSP